MKTWSDLQEHIAQHELLLVYYSTPTCQVCKVLRPQVEDLVKATPGWSYQYIDLSTAPEIQGQGLIFTVPTLVLYVGGTEAKRFSRNLAVGELEADLIRYAELIS